ncbi:MAG: hypothetical protein U9P14_03450 [Gemmatimonadota bacterium]|nr:hypothetical protein [Gemmatimonadota bacterium]
MFRQKHKVYISLLFKGTTRIVEMFRQKHKVYISLLFIGIAIVITAYLFFLNRASGQLVSMIVTTVAIGFVGAFMTLWFSLEKERIVLYRMIPTLAIGVVGAFFTLFFSLEESKIEESVVAGLIAHADRMTPLEEIKHEYHMYYGGNLLAARCYLNPFKDQELFDFHFDVISVEILQMLFGTYQAFRKEPHGKIFSMSSTSGFPTYLDTDRDFLTWEQYIGLFKGNERIYRQLSSINTSHEAVYMTIPKGACISIEANDMVRSISFMNEFVDFTIRITVYSARRDIQEWGWILGLKETEREQYWISYFIIDMEASFKRLRAGHPEMIKHKEWVNTLMKRIRSSYDYEKQLSKATEFYAVFGDKVITQRNSPDSSKK